MLRAVNGRFACLLVVTANALASSQEVRPPDTPQLVHIAPEPSERFPAKWYTRRGDGTEVFPAPVVDRPFRATVETMTASQSPPDGPLQQIEKGFRARDRFGRTRSESHDGQTWIGETAVPTEVVLVSDPVSHCAFDWVQPMANGVLLPGRHIAWVSCLPQTLRYQDWNLPEANLAMAVDGTRTHGDTTTQTEHLAALQIDGLAITRLRITNSYRSEKGEVRRNATETWYSPDLKEIIRIGDELGGYEALTDIHRDDPDPNLFYPPAGYEILVRAPR